MNFISPLRGKKSLFFMYLVHIGDILYVLSIEQNYEPKKGVTLSDVIVVGF